MIILDTFPNWTSGMSLKYEFGTTIRIADNRKEQRALIQGRPAREVSFSVLEDAPESVKMVNTLLSSARTEICVPILSEEFGCTATGDLNGLSAITANRALEFLYNLQAYRGAVILYDKSGTNEPEMLTMGGAPSGDTISIDPIVGHTEGKYARFFPAMVGYLDEIPTESDISDYLAECGITIRERRAL